MKVDYLLVGYGIANICFAKYCIENNKSFIIYDDQKMTASNVAAGVVNPVVLKRFSPVWNAVERMDLLKKTFNEFKNLLGGEYFKDLSIYRILANDKEIEIWQRKRIENHILEKYLKRKIEPNNYNVLKADHGFGVMNETGYVVITELLADFKKKYKEHFINEKLEYKELDIENKTYRNISFDKIVFAEGAKVLNNPFFNFVPLEPNKGQVLKIRTEEELPQAIIKSKCFLMPIGGYEYYVGATYNVDFENEEATLKDREKLQEQLETFFKGHYQIIDEKVGLRPTVPDRKPIIGEHSNHKGMYILNGLGTRGTFNGPSMAKQLFDYIENGKEIPSDVDLKRFQNT